jgi:hypothetical protein
MVTVIDDRDCRAFDSRLEAAAELIRRMSDDELQELRTRTIYEVVRERSAARRAAEAAGVS